jgi:hypothetical protein
MLEKQDISYKENGCSHPSDEKTQNMISLLIRRIPDILVPPGSRPAERLQPVFHNSSSPSKKLIESQELSRIGPCFSVKLF